MLVGLNTAAVSTCLYVYDGNMTTCSFDVIKEGNGNEITFGGDYDPLAPSVLEYDQNIGFTENYEEVYDK